MRFLGLDDRPPPEHVQRALDAAAIAREAIDSGANVAKSYWAGRTAEAEEDRHAQHLRLAKIDAAVGVQRARPRKPRGTAQ